MKPVFIDQPELLGDILFLRKMARVYADQGRPVIYPIERRYSWMLDYFEPHPLISMPCNDENFPLGHLRFHYGHVIGQQPIETPEVTYLPLHWSWRVDPPRTMYLKYEITGIGYDDWASYAGLVRNTAREDDLFYNVLKLKDDQPFTLLNTYYSNGSMNLPSPPNEHVVYMQTISGFTLFDWAKVIERASRIVTVDTSLVLLAEVLSVSGKLHVVSRYNPPSFVQICDLLKLNWQFALKPSDLDFSI